uniref:Putative secreted protein n=1 Tax=Anopheles triannulatus TaxID=58253 RepID=A0A2M4B3L4_9DIPT
MHRQRLMIVEMVMMVVVVIEIGHQWRTTATVPGARRLTTVLRRLHPQERPQSRTGGRGGCRHWVQLVLR